MWSLTAINSLLARRAKEGLWRVRRFARIRFDTSQFETGVDVNEEIPPKASISPCARDPSDVIEMTSHESALTVSSSASVARNSMAFCVVHWTATSPTIASIPPRPRSQPQIILRKARMVSQEGIRRFSK